MLLFVKLETVKNLLQHLRRYEVLLQPPSPVPLTGQSELRIPADVFNIIYYNFNVA